MVRAPRGNYKRRTTAAEIAEEHREDPNRNTYGDYSEDDLLMKYLSPIKRGLWSPKTRHMAGALVGWFDFSQQRRNELNETRSPLLPRQSSGRVYHCMDLIVGDLTGYQSTPLDCAGDPLPSWRELFTGWAWTDLDANRFPRSNWEDINNSYYLQPAFADSTAPESVDAPNGQAALGDYSDVDPCDYSDVRECSCCVCPECGSVAIRERKDRIRAEKYACGNPACDSGPFPDPDVFPTRRED
jgi:hypothetical protein